MEFMDGVTIIEECTKLSETGVILKIFILFSTIVLSLILFFDGTILSIKNGNVSDAYEIIGGVLAFVFCISSLVISKNVILKYFQEPNGEYKVVIDTDVDMNEFYRRYEIVGFKDGIYTITLKDSREGKVI